MRDAAVLFLCAVLLYCSDTAMEAALSSAQVFVNGVLPALFPMMILSRLLSPRAGRTGAAAFCRSTLFAFLSGSPASAQRAALADVSARLWEPLVCASGVMSPMFFTGTLASWTGNAEAARRMLLTHWMGALLSALIWSFLPTGAPLAPPEQTENRTSLPGAIAQSARAMLSVLGAMMLFSILANVLGRMLAPFGPGAQLMAVMWALLEIGGGSRAVVSAFPSPPFALLCALCSFGGLSIWLQNLLFLGKRIRPAKLLCMRALHGAVSWGLYSLISFL